MTTEIGCLHDAHGRLLVLRQDPAVLTLLQPGTPTVLLLDLDDRGARRLRELLGRYLGEDSAELVRDLAECQRTCQGLADRVAVQSELLARRAEKEDDRG